MAIVLAIVVYFIGVPALTIAAIALLVVIAAWWLYYLLFGPPERHRSI